MKTIFAKISLVILLTPVFALGQWSARQSLGNTNSRSMATAFAIGTKIYLVGGQFNFNALEEVWEYDVTSDIWTQKSDFPGGIRRSASAFSIGGKGYFMCGSNMAGQYFQDVWEYDPGSDTWTQKGNFPGSKREEAVAFAIGNKGYLGTGYLETVGPNSTFFSTFSDFWEYDPTNDSWIMKALIPGPQRGWAIGASVGGKGYVGLGGNSSQNGSYSDFYEYDPANDSWTAKTSYGLAVSDAMAFTLGQDVYVCGGINFTNFAGSAALKRFNPITNTWSTMSNMGGFVTMGAVGLTAMSRAFVGTGYTGNITERDDWWEFASATTTTCPGPISFATATMATNGTVQCDGKIMISSIMNGCAPFTVSIAGTTTVLTGSGPSFTLSGLCNTTYTVSVKDNNCCGTTASVCIVPGNMTTGLNENALEGSLVIFPNPNQGTFKIMSYETICIKNSLGQDVAFERIQTGNAYEIKLLQPQKGIYTVITGKESKQVKKIVVQ